MQYVMRLQTQICSYCEWNETQSEFLQRDAQLGILVRATSAPEAKFACEIIQTPIRRVPICARCIPQRSHSNKTSEAAAWAATLARKRAQAEAERTAKATPAAKPAPTLKDIL